MSHGDECGHTYHVGFPTPPRFQTTPVGLYGSTAEPLSPKVAHFVVLKSPPKVCAFQVPPAKPQGSLLPGACVTASELQTSA